jgi:hypothetical protein
VSRLARPATRRDARHAETVAAGRPELAVADQDREGVEDLLAELLVRDLERDTEGNAA